MSRSIATAVLVLPLSLASSPAPADEARPAVAPPGPCAEPRVAGGGAADGYAVAGPVASLFDPRDVAAGPPEGGPQRPQPPTALVRPGPCDQPGAGCGASRSTSTVIEVPPIGSGVRPPRAAR